MTEETPTRHVPSYGGKELIARLTRLDRIDALLTGLQEALDEYDRLHAGYEAAYEAGNFGWMQRHKDWQEHVIPQAVSLLQAYCTAHELLTKAGR